MKFWAYSLRGLWRRPSRTVLTVTGIIIGVAAVVSVSLATETTRVAYREMFAAAGGRASLEVVALGEGGFSPEVAEELEGVSGVEAAVPGAQANVAVVAEGVRAQVLLVGVDTARTGGAEDYEVVEGTGLGSLSGGQVLMVSGFAEGLGKGVGDRIRLLSPGGLVDVEIVGLISPRGIAAFNGGAVAVTSLGEAQRLLSLGANVDTVKVILGEGADEPAVREKVAALLPQGLRVQTPASRGDIARMSMLSAQSGLDSLSALAVVAGAFVILNAFLMNLGERKTEIGLLRSLGMERGQVTRLLLRETLLMSVVGTLLGLAAGLGGAAVLVLGMEKLLGVSLPSLHITWNPFITGLVLGPGLALAATVVPARRAGRASPLEGIRSRGEREDRQSVRRWPAYTGLVLLLVSAGMGVGLVSGRVPGDLGPLLLVGLLVGCVMAIPLVQGPLIRWGGELVARAFGVEGRLALLQLDRQRTRTGLTVGVMFVAVAVAVSMGSSMVANVRDVGEWYERTIVGDYFIRAAMPETGTNRAAGLPLELGEELRDITGVKQVHPFVFLPSSVDEKNSSAGDVVVLARTFSPDRPLPLDLAEGTEAEVLDSLLSGDAVVGTALAQRLGVVPGDEITLHTRIGPTPLRVAGTVTEYTAGGSAVYLDWERATELFDIRRADTFMVSVKEDYVGRVGADLDRLVERKGLLLQTLSDFRVLVDEMIQGVMAFLWLLLALIFVVASLGIINTLTMNVLEQRRDLGLLRALGMTRGRLRRMVFAQAGVVAVASVVPGLVLGVAMAFLLNRGTNAVLGQPVAFRLEPMVLLGAFVVALVMSGIAAYFPARRAGALDIVQTLHYE